MYRLIARTGCDGCQACSEMHTLQKCMPSVAHLPQSQATTFLYEVRGNRLQNTCPVLLVAHPVLSKLQVHKSSAESVQVVVGCTQCTLVLRACCRGVTAGVGVLSKQTVKVVVHALIRMPLHTGVAATRIRSGRGKPASQIGQEHCNGSHLLTTLCYEICIHFGGHSSH